MTAKAHNNQNDLRVWALKLPTHVKLKAFTSCRNYINQFNLNWCKLTIQIEIFNWIEIK